MYSGIVQFSSVDTRFTSIAPQTYTEKIFLMHVNCIDNRLTEIPRHLNFFIMLFAEISEYEIFEHEHRL